MAKRNSGNNIWVRIVAGILALLMVGSLCFTLLFYVFAK
jgi:hypothetical protein